MGDVRKRVGLLPTYVSRVERGCTVPSLDTLEKLACALDVPLYRFFCNGSRPNGHTARFPKSRTWGSSAVEARQFLRLQRLLTQINDADRQLLLLTARKMVYGFLR